MSRRISYAHNGEDVVLHRALQDVPSVTYVDVGAGDPVVDSMSRSLHELGWRGIHVEPVPSYARSLRDQRPRDVVVEGGAGTAEAVVPFWFVPGSGLSTTSKEEADQARRRGWAVNESSIPVRPLADILDEHLDGRVLHALRVSVGGGEGEVLRGADLARHRPWLLVVKAVHPPSQERTHDLWEELVTGLGYVRALFDGLSQWYVSPDHPELVERVSYPACPADPWIRVGLGFPDPPGGDAAQVLSSAALRLAAAVTGQRAAEAVAEDLRTETQRLRAEVQELRAEARQLASRASEQERAAAKRRAQVEAMQQSTSWRVTRPLRALGSPARRRRPQP